ncbi:Tox-REase-5 domain-containing protein [Stenotrophomonas sp. 24(2023)]|uniref:Tox-REase-5 domain-containing protein n=1 Tax=Stenotrophomonas sp. 24(2023) TaxID=3068324 RepID=UPI0027E1B360|nr:Tox-REase-5 domain-containing protein [Stenotrophomonas sp. 24(2023)]WMJ68914.1 Tox-REase-5 domain-containing protein [Stenotrophomonas sp. 24(2023)]
MATTLPTGIRAIGQLISRSVAMRWPRPATGVVPLEGTRTGDCSSQGDATDCNACALGKGALVPAAPRRAVRRQNKLNWDYQLQIANMHAGPEHFSYCDKDTGLPITDFDTSLAGRAISAIKGAAQPNAEQLNLIEWLYGGVYFDGFWRSQCTVVDAKGRYAQFLSRDDGTPAPGFAAEIVFPGLILEANRQISAISTALPQAKLQWHFMQAEVCSWVTPTIPKPIICHHTPYAQKVIQA